MEATAVSVPSQSEQQGWPLYKFWRPHTHSYPFPSKAKKKKKKSTSGTDTTIVALGHYVNRVYSTTV